MTHSTENKLSIVIANYNSCQLLKRCLQSIHSSGINIPFEIIVVDNGSTDGSIEMVEKKFPQVRLFKNSVNLGFAAATNQGIRQAKGNYILLLNSDTIVLPGAINNLISFLDTQPNEAVVAPKLLNEDGTFQRSFFEFPNPLKVFFHILGISRYLNNLMEIKFLKIALSFLPGFKMAILKKEPINLQKVPYVLLACTLIRKEVFNQIGLLDENLFLYHEDCEFGYRMKKAGLNIWWLPESQIIHKGGGSTRKIALEAFQHYFQSLIYLFSKHESKLSQLLLRLVIFFGFLWKAILTPFGFYSYLEIPSTYKRKSLGNKSLNQYPLIDRLQVYFKIALMAFTSKSNVIK